MHKLLSSEADLAFCRHHTGPSRRDVSHVLIGWGYRSVEASSHLALFLTACNIALPIINRTLGLVKGQIDDLKQKYVSKTA